MTEELKPLAVNVKIAAKLLGSTVSSLEKDRRCGHMGVPYTQAGRRVVYRVPDLEAWLLANRVVPNKEQA